MKRILLLVGVVNGLLWGAFAAPFPPPVSAP